MVDDEIAALTRRTQTVADLVSIVRAAIGDGEGEFSYLAFQVRGSKIILVRCTAEQFEKIERVVGEWRQKGLDIPSQVIARLTE